MGDRVETVEGNYVFEQIDAIKKIPSRHAKIILLLYVDLSLYTDHRSKEAHVIEEQLSRWYSKASDEDLELIANNLSCREDYREEANKVLLHAGLEVVSQKNIEDYYLNLTKVMRREARRLFGD